MIDKPEGMTSHDVVDRVRRITGLRKVGHAGTLDPFATGLLVVGVGRPATREMQRFVGLDKKYEATFVLGAVSDTDDKDGVITEAPITSDEDPRVVIQEFVGTIAQVPPAYSAIKIGGKKMYEAAREGKPLKAEPREVTIYSIGFHERLVPQPQVLDVTIHSSSGTYIRAIARDLGERLGGGGYVEQLRRTAVGSFESTEAVTLETLKQDGAQDYLIPVEKMLERL